MLYTEKDNDPLFDPDAFAPSPAKQKGKKSKKNITEDSKSGLRLRDLFDIDNPLSVQSKGVY